MTYPLHQRIFHEFLYYLHNVEVHCCARAVKHYRRRLIKSIICAVNVMNQKARIHLASSEVVWHFCGPSSTALLHLAVSSSIWLCVGFIAKPHRNFQKSACCFFIQLNVHKPSTLTRSLKHTHKWPNVHFVSVQTRLWSIETSFKF